MRERVRTLGIMVVATMIVGCTSAPRFTATKSASVRAGMETGGYSMVEEGAASYYASEFNGRPTSSGETFDMNQLTAAHRTLPFNTMVRVTNLTNGRTVTVRINDRGPFKDDRLIDLSLAAAKEIGLVGTGTARVRLEVVELGSTNTIKNP